MALLYALSFGVAIFAHAASAQLPGPMKATAPEKMMPHDGPHSDLLTEFPYLGPPRIVRSPRRPPTSLGNGNMTYLCGECETSVLETVEYKQVRDLVVKCKKCGCYNDIPPSHHPH